MLPFVTLTVALGAATVFARHQQAAPAVDLTNPAAFTETAPDVYGARFETTGGGFTVKVTRNWGPNGADRFYNLVKSGFYDNNRIFRVITGYIMQWGVHGDPKVSAAWNKAQIKADRAKMTNTRGRISFAQGAFASQRSTQVFINYGDNSKKLDADGYAAFGEVTQGMALMDQLYDKYGEGPDQKFIFAEGNAFLAKNFPQLDYIKTARLVDLPK